MQEGKEDRYCRPFSFCPSFVLDACMNTALCLLILGYSESWDFRLADKARQILFDSSLDDQDDVVFYHVLISDN